MAKPYARTPGVRILNRLMGTLARLGVAPGRTTQLTVVGPSSGVPRTTPVYVFESDGSRGVVSPYGEREWVKNGRADPHAGIRRARCRERVRLDEVDAATAAPSFSPTWSSPATLAPTSISPKTQHSVTSNLKRPVTPSSGCTRPDPNTQASPATRKESPMPQAHFGVMVPQIKRSWDDARRAATAFEDLGFDSIWVNDHLYGPQSPSIPILEAWSTVAALAASTQRVEIGTLVTPAGMRNPAHLGKVIASIDNIAGGRIIPGIGAGWMPREYTDFDVPFPATADRLGQMREAVELLRGMWDPEQESFSYDGKYFRAENVVCLPKPPRAVPLLIGGSGEKVTLKLAAQHADIWNNLASHHGELPHKIDVFRQHCDTVGRDPAEVTISQQVLVTIAPDQASLGPAVERAQKIFGGHMGDPAGPIALTGTPDMVAERIQHHIDLGCTMFMMEFFGRDTVEPARLLAEQVAPHFR